MRFRLAPIVVILGLCSCSGNERSAEYFAVHEAEAKQAVADCTAGSKRGKECENALAGLRKANGAKAYKKSDFPVTGGRKF